MSQNGAFSRLLSEFGSASQQKASDVSEKTAIVAHQKADDRKVVARLTKKDVGTAAGTGKLEVG
jgi:hypothetical protein